MHSGNIIRLLREAEGLSQLELADRLQVARTYLSQVENEKREPSIQLLKNVAVIFNIPMALLFLDNASGHSDVMNQLQQVLTHVLNAKRQCRHKFGEKSQAAASSQSTN